MFFSVRHVQYTHGINIHIELEGSVNTPNSQKEKSCLMALMVYCKEQNLYRLGKV